MKQLQLYCLTLLLIASGSVHAQLTTVKKELKKIPKESIAQRPSSFDSTKTLAEQFSDTNKYKFIGLQLYLPPVVHPENGPVIFSKHSHDFTKGNRYYTITDVLSGNFTKELKAKKLTNQCGYRYKDIGSPQWNDLIIYTVFVLQDNNKKDSLNNAPVYWVVSDSKQAPHACSNFNTFIAEPYFKKQQQLYQQQDVIDLNNKSKWFCKKVTLLKSWNNNCQDSTYDIFCILTNNNGEKMQLRPPTENSHSFLTIKRYNWLNNADRNERMQLYKEQKEKREKHLAYCVKKFGQHYGEQVAKGTIATGMTTAMCQLAWGKPWKVDKNGPSAEIWHYNWKYRLYFKKDKLILIAH